MESAFHIHIKFWNEIKLERKKIRWKREIFILYISVSAKTSAKITLTPREIPKQCAYVNDD